MKSKYNFAICISRGEGHILYFVLESLVRLCIVHISAHIPEVALHGPVNRADEDTTYLHAFVLQPRRITRAAAKHVKYCSGM